MLKTRGCIMNIEEGDIVLELLTGRYGCVKLAFPNLFCVDINRKHYIYSGKELDVACKADKIMSN